MPHFYLKVAFHHKIKKYAITLNTPINFLPIHASLSLPQSNDSLIYYQLHDAHDHTNLLTQEQLQQQLTAMDIVPNSTLKLIIVEKKCMSQEDKRRKESECDLQIPVNIQKKRSKSVQISLDLFDQTCQTQFLDSTLNFIAPEISTSQLSNSNHSSQTPHKTFSKSAQIQIQTSTTSNQQEHSRMISSLNYPIDLGKISEFMKESMQASEKQKSELEMLKERMARKEEQNKIQKLRKQKQVKDALKHFGLHFNSN